MRRTLPALLLLACLAPATHAASIAADLQQAWARQKALLVRTVDAMPEESFRYKPTDAQRTFGAQVLHVAGANSFLFGFTGAEAKGLEFTMGNFATFGLEASTKVDYLELLEKSFDHGIAALGEFDDEAMLAEVQGPPWVGEVTREI